MDLEHIDHYIEFDIEYDKDSLIELYNKNIVEFPSIRNLTSPFNSVSEDLDLSDNKSISHIFDELRTIPRNNKFYTLTTLEKRTVPHTNPGCNGNIIFPLSGTLFIDIFSYNPPVIDGRPLLDPMPRNRKDFTDKDEMEVQQSFIKTIKVERPIALNGLKVHALMPSVADKPLFFAIKIPLNLTWKEVSSFIQTKLS